MCHNGSMWTLRTCLALCLVTATSLVRGQEPDSGRQSLPTPNWVKMFDQGEADGRLKGYRTPRGIKLEVAAQQPAVVNPRLLAFDGDGQPYVIEWRLGELREESQDVALEGGRSIPHVRTTKSTRDVLKSLHDTNGDGVFDEARVVLDDLELPSGLLIDHGWFYWTSGGRILRR